MPTVNRLFVRIVLVAMLALTVGAALAVPLLQAGDRLVFLGDSTTEQRIYTRYVMNYFTLRYPGVNISFRNAGLHGDTAPKALKRLQRDVLSLKPTVVSICLGMNDGAAREFNQDAYTRYMTGMTGLVTELKKAGVKVVLLSPSCVDLDRRAAFKGKNWTYNDTLGKLGAGVKELAVNEKQTYYDLHALMLDVQKKAKVENAKFTMIPDAVHPDRAGQAVMAYALLKALGCTDQPSSLEINVTKSTIAPTRCKVDALKVGEKTITFIRTDDALPTYFDPETAAIGKYLPLTEELNQYTIKVTGLKAGEWNLTVDNKPVATFTADKLAVGVNLAALPGPWLELGKRVNALSYDQERLYLKRWRQFGPVPVPVGSQDEYKAFLNKLDQLIAARETSRLQAVAARTWKWSLTAK